MSRYHITAWGSADRPDIEYLANEVHPDLSWQYPCVSVQLLEIIPLDALKQAIEDGR